MPAIFSFLLLSCLIRKFSTLYYCFRNLSLYVIEVHYCFNKLFVSLLFEDEMSLHFSMPKIRTIAVSSHFPLPKHRTFRFSLHTSCLTIVALKFTVHTFRGQKICPLCSDSLLNGASRATSDRKPKTHDQTLPSPILCVRYFR